MGIRWDGSTPASLMTLIARDLVLACRCAWPLSCLNRYPSMGDRSLPFLPFCFHSCTFPVAVSTASFAATPVTVTGALTQLQLSWWSCCCFGISQKGLHRIPADDFWITTGPGTVSQCMQAFEVVSDALEQSRWPWLW